MIVAPLAHSMESTQTTASDVYIFWLAIAASLKDIFSKGVRVTRISNRLAAKVTAIVNKQYHGSIDESPSDIYFIAFFLDTHESI